MNEIDFLKKRVEVLEKILVETQVSETEKIESIEKLQKKVSNAVEIGATMISRFESVSKREAVVLMLSRIGGLDV